VVDAEEEALGGLPTGLSFAGGEADQFEGVPVGVAKVGSLDPSCVGIPSRQPLGRRTGVTNPVGVEPVAGGADIADHDGHMLKPQVIAAAVRRHRPAQPPAFIEDDGLAAQPEVNGPPAGSGMLIAVGDDFEIEGGLERASGSGSIAHRQGDNWNLGRRPGRCHALGHSVTPLMCGSAASSATRPVPPVRWEAMRPAAVAAYSRGGQTPYRAGSV
jgi:hypothetical protein